MSTPTCRPSRVRSHVPAAHLHAAQHCVPRGALHRAVPEGAARAAPRPAPACVPVAASARGPRAHGGMAGRVRQRQDVRQGLVRRGAVVNFALGERQSVRCSSCHDLPGPLQHGHAPHTSVDGDGKEYKQTHCSINALGVSSLPAPGPPTRDSVWSSTCAPRTHAHAGALSCTRPGSTVQHAANHC